MGAIACGFVMSLTSCGKADSPIVVNPTTTITFEGAKLNADGF